MPVPLGPVRPLRACPVRCAFSNANFPKKRIPTTHVRAGSADNLVDPGTPTDRGTPTAQGFWDRRDSEGFRDRHREMAGYP